MIEPVSLNKHRRFLFFTIIALTSFGLLIVYEASCVSAFCATGDAMYFFKRQVIYFLIGLILFFLTLFADLEFLRRYNRAILIANCILLLVLLVVGTKGGGAKRWFNIFYFNIQPSEILKVTFLVYAADYFQRKGAIIRDFKHGILPLGIVLCFICALLVVQPDLGSAVFWFLWVLIFLFLCRADKRHIILIGLSAIVAAVFLIKFFPYRFRRITAYLDPFADPRGAGFQIIQSQIAYGEGGVIGTGLGEGKQKLFFLPAAHTDFIFSIVAEEFGLAGVLGIFAIFAIIFNKMMAIVRMAREPFRRNILSGILLIFFLEIFINIGVSSGFLPTKGLSLPFISYGGSNMLAHYVLLGLFFNASRIQPEGHESTASV
jgi:cell division protein FtsW